MVDILIMYIRKKIGISCLKKFIFDETLDNVFFPDFDILTR